MATYHDIRRLTGLSLSTISKYFNGRHVLDENRAAIEAAVATLGFRPNEFARGLRSRRSRTVGVLLPALDNDFHLRIIAGVERTLRARGVSVMVRSNGWAWGEGEGDADDAVNFLASKMVDGLIVVPSPSDEAALARLDHLPVVLVDRIAHGVRADTVVLDNRDASGRAARLLLDHGHRDIAIIGGDPRIWTMTERLAGFSEAAAARDLSLADEYVSQNPLTVRGGTDAMRRLLALKSRPTGVFCTNYELTIGAVIALNDSGLRIPQDMSFIGFDSLELSQVTKPRMTMIAQPVEQIAAEAAKLMLARLSGPDVDREPQHIELSGELVVGGSVAERR